MADYKDPDAFYDARIGPELDAINGALRDVAGDDGQSWPYAQAFASLCDRVLSVSEATGPVGGWSYAQAFSSLCDRMLALSKSAAAIEAKLDAILVKLDAPSA